MIQVNLKRIGVETFRGKEIEIEGYLEGRCSYFCSATENIRIGHFYIFLKLDNLSVFLVVFGDSRRIGKGEVQ